MKHNKNADVLLVYSALLRMISKAIVFESTQNKRDASVAKKLIKTHFSKKCLKEYIEAAHVIMKWNLDPEEKDMAELMLQEIRDFFRSRVTLKEYNKDKIDFLQDVKKI